MPTEQPAALVDRVARAFSKELIVEIGEDAVREAARRNAAEPNRAICHSHDFCDANMVMAAAVAGALNVGIDALDMDSDEALQLWNDAWSSAMRAKFFTD